MKVKGIKTGASIALVGILAGGGGAYAAGQITSAQIKDGTITAKDIKKGTISTANLSAAAKKGMTGPAGATGATGPQGPKGDPGPSVVGSPGATKGDKGDRARRATRARRARLAPRATPEPRGQPVPRATRARPAPPARRAPPARQAVRRVPQAQPVPQAPRVRPARSALLALLVRRARPGPAGGADIVRVVSEPVPNGTSDEEWVAEAVATCPDGYKIVSGGYIQDILTLGSILYNAPDEDDTSWIIDGVNWGDPDDPDIAEGDLIAVAYCTPAPNAQKAPYAERHAAALAEARAHVKRLKSRR